MYKNLLPHHHNAHVPTDHERYVSHLCGSPHYPLARALRAGANHVRHALRRTTAMRARRQRRSMGWWD